MTDRFRQICRQYLTIVCLITNTTVSPPSLQCNASSRKLHIEIYVSWLADIFSWSYQFVLPNPYWIFMIVHEFWVIRIKYVIYFYILLALFCAIEVRKRVDIFSDSNWNLDLLPFRKLTITLYNENNHIGPQADANLMLITPNVEFLIRLHNRKLG